MYQLLSVCVRFVRRWPESGVHGTVGFVGGFVLLSSAEEGSARLQTHFEKDPSSVRLHRLLHLPPWIAPT